MKKILLAPNSFKECSGSIEVAEILSRKFSQYKNIRVTSVPISDGGDGFLNVCKSKFNLKMLTYLVTSPYSNKLIDVRIGYNEKRSMVFIESAEIIGLHRIPVEKRHPLLLNSKGLGELLKQIDVSDLNVEKVIIGIGGTGTSDLGLGLCSVFGFEIIDFFGKKMKVIPDNYFVTKEISWKKQNLRFDIELVVDVDNPLLGENGAVKTFAAQKGATRGEIDALELGFTKIVKLLKKQELIDGNEFLSGAGGGLAAGLQIFFGAKLRSSENFIKNDLLQEQNVSEFDLVVTGEGAFNAQSFMNKGAGIILQICSENKVPCALVCGKIEKDLLDNIKSPVYPVELELFFNGDISKSIREFKKGLELAAEKIISYINV